MNEIIEKIRKYSVNLYLVKKVRKNVYNAVRFPNDIDQQIRDTYVSNIEHFVEGKSFVEYDYVHSTKHSITKLSTNKISVWENIKNSILEAKANNIVLKKKTFNDDYTMIVLEFIDDNQATAVYAVAKYMKTKTWYKKSVKFAFLTDAVVEKKDDIFVLNGNIDVIISDDESYVLIEKNFEDIFNYFETAKEYVEESKSIVNRWEFLTNTDNFFAKVLKGKTRILKFANALKNAKTDWNNVSKEDVKAELINHKEFSSINFDEEGKIICTEENVDIIIDIIKEVYSKQLFTNQIIQTKGV